jgi:hypothetical protein
MRKDRDNNKQELLLIGTKYSNVSRVRQIRYRNDTLISFQLPELIMTKTVALKPHNSLSIVIYNHIHRGEPSIYPQMPRRADFDYKKLMPNKCLI